MSELTCTCHVVPERYHTTHYGATEPGSALEPDYDCAVHFPGGETGATAVAKALAPAIPGLVDAALQVEKAADELAAAMGWSGDAVVSNLMALRDYRCWKRIPRCFNGWGVGLCALPNWHDGDCSPIPARRRA